MGKEREVHVGVKDENLRRRERIRRAERVQNGNERTFKEHLKKDVVGPIVNIAERENKTTEKHSCAWELGGHM